MNRISMFGRLEALIALVALGYLGFWTYGLVMGVFALGELLFFTTITALILVGFGIYAIRRRRAAARGTLGEADETLAKAARHQREVRGF